MVKIQGIYQIRNKTNGNVYIGSSVDIERRWGEHIRSLNRYKNHHNPYLQRAWDKYGENSFIFEIIEIVNSIDNLINKEQEYLDKLNLYDYNIAKDATNGMIGRTHSEETRVKMSESKKGKIFSKEHIKNMSNSGKGRMFSSEHKKNISISKSGKKNYWYGKQHSKETIEKMKIAHTGKKNGMWKKTHSDKSKRKQSLANSGEKAGNSKLKDVDILKIREIYSGNNYTLIEIGKIFNTSFGNIHKIVNRETWKHI